MGMAGENYRDVVLDAIGEERPAVECDALVVAAGKVVWQCTRRCVVFIVDRGMMHGDDLVLLMVSPDVFKEVHLGVGQAAALRGRVPDLRLDFPSAVVVSRVKEDEVAVPVLH